MTSAEVTTRQGVTADQRARASLVGRYERLPEGIVDGIYLNESLRKTRDPKILWWIVNEDYLEKQALAIALGLSDNGAEGTVRRVQTPTGYRSAILSMGGPFFDEYGTAYGFIRVKGSGLTEYGATQRQDFMYLGNPQGVFREEPSQIDKERSNDFAKRGGRTSRNIARIELNPDKLREFIRTRPSSDIYPMEEHLDMLINSGSKPVYNIDLQGADRFSDFALAANQPDLSGISNLQNGIFSTNNIFRRGLYIFSSEIQNDPVLFQQKYGIKDRNIIQALILRDKGINPFRSPITQDLADNYFLLQAYLAGFNMARFSSMSKDKYGGALKPPHPDLDGQNYDVVAAWNDYQETSPIYRPLPDAKHLETLLQFTQDMSITVAQEHGLYSYPDQQGLMRIAAQGYNVAMDLEKAA